MRTTDARGVTHRPRHVFETLQQAGEDIADVRQELTRVGRRHFDDQFLHHQTGSLAHRVVLCLRLRQLEFKECRQVVYYQVNSYGLPFHDCEILPHLQVVQFHPLGEILPVQTYFGLDGVVLRFVFFKCLHLQEHTACFTCCHPHLAPIVCQPLRQDHIHFIEVLLNDCIILCIPHFSQYLYILSQCLQ